MLPLRTAVDLGRFRGLLPIALLLAIFVVGADLLVLAWSGPVRKGRTTDDRHVIAWSELEHAESQVANLESALGDPKKPFIVYLGGSTANQGIDPAVLRRLGPCHTPAMGLCMVGSGMSRIRDIARPFLRRRLHASLALVGINEFSLAGPFNQEPPVSINPIAPLGHGDWRESVRRLRWWNWFSTNHGDTEYMIMAGLIEARGWLDLSPKVDPWLPPPLVVPDHASQAYVDFQLQSMRSNGFFDPQRYLLHRDAEAEALEELVSRFQELGTEVILVLLPETSTLRSGIPAEEVQFLFDSMTRRFSAAAPAILNFRDAMPDEMFSDYGHLSNAGRAKFSLQLVQALSDRPYSTTCRAN